MDSNTDEPTYEDWACPVCGTLIDAASSECQSCGYTTEETDDGRSRLLRWTTAVAVGGLAVIAGLGVLVVGVQTLDPGLAPVPVITGMGIVTVGLNLAVEALDW